MTGPAADGLARAVGRVLGSPVVATAAVRGGDVASNYRMQSSDGTTVFVKSVAATQPGLLTAEAAGLEWLAETTTVRVPRLLAVEDGPGAGHRFLALEWIETGRPSLRHDEHLGCALADLHGAPCAGFGLAEDNWLANLPQDNRPAPSWSEFYATRRLEPLARRARDAGSLDAGAVALVDRVMGRLGALIGDDPGPSRLHGDLWGGNALVDAAGEPMLIDPAVYGGDAEVDLAMMRLFGGFSPTVFAAYDEVRPPRAGRDDRVPLYQLYPLLAHVVLFGRGYADSVLAALRACT